MMTTSKKQDATSIPQELAAPHATKDRLRVADALAKAYEAIDDQSGLVTQVCKSARAVFEGNTIPKHDMEAIVEKVAEKRKWSEKSKASRISEMRAVLRVYDQLPDVIKAYREKAETSKFTWHNAISLARHVKSLDSIDDAVKQILCKDDGEKSDQVRKTVKLTTNQKKTYDQAIELAKSEIDTESDDEALAAIIEWYVDSREVAIAA